MVLTHLFYPDSLQNTLTIPEHPVVKPNVAHFAGR